MDTLRELFRYHAWATLQLLDHCATLPPEALHESAPGTYGDVISTFVHLLAAEQRYLSRLPAAAPTTPVREGTELPLVSLRAAAIEQAARWQTLLDGWDGVDVTMPPQSDGWPETPHAETLMALQTLHHGNDHRTQIGTMLGANGRDVPDIDGWSYWEALQLPQP